LKALSVMQPWAQLIASRQKTIETRSWMTLWRGPLVIHASQSPRFLKDRELLESLRRNGLALDDGQVVGAAVAVAMVADCRRTEALVGTPLGRKEHAAGNFSARRWGIILESVRPLITPVPVKGALGLWMVPPAARAEILAQLDARWQSRFGGGA